MAMFTYLRTTMTNQNYDVEGIKGDRTREIIATSIIRNLRLRAPAM